MALPSSGQLSLNDIRVELGLAQSNVSLHSMSVTAGFSTPDAVSEFWGYPPTPNYRTFSIVNTKVSAGEVCSIIDEDNLTLYYGESGGDGSPGCPSTGVYLWEDTALSIAFDGSNSYWFSNQCSAGYYIVDNGDLTNFIEGITPCE
jgi:hypothetical protein